MFTKFTLIAGGFVHTVKPRYNELRREPQKSSFYWELVKQRAMKTPKNKRLLSLVDKNRSLFLIVEIN